MTRAEIITEIKSNFESNDSKALRVDSTKHKYVITNLYEVTNKDSTPCLIVDVLQLREGNVLRGYSAMLKHGADRCSVSDDDLLADIHVASAISDNYINDLVVLDR